MKIYYDGNYPEKYKNKVEGFTTNITFAGQSVYKKYTDYIKNYLSVIGDTPCSFQVWSDDDEEITKQADKIASMGKNIFVKIPIIKSNGKDNISAIKKVLDNIKSVNITAVYTKNHIDKISSLLPIENDIIVSVFAGGISDAGVDPISTMRYAVDSYKERKNIEVLWAGCQTNLHIVQAKECGCHIITIPDSVINKMDRMNFDLETSAAYKVRRFIDDFKEMNFKGTL